MHLWEGEFYEDGVQIQAVFTNWCRRWMRQRLPRWPGARGEDEAASCAAVLVREMAAGQRIARCGETLECVISVRMS